MVRFRAALHASAVFLGAVVGARFNRGTAAGNADYGKEQAAHRSDFKWAARVAAENLKSTAGNNNPRTVVLRCDDRLNCSR
jgi:hypothetical protein